MNTTQTPDQARDDAVFPTRVMVVDDEDGVRRSWDRFLTEQGFSVTTMPDGVSAMEALEANPTDVVVSDLRMPGPDGLELLSWVRDHTPETQFILLTGYGNDSVEQRARDLGAFQYLNKPISPQALAGVITAATHLGILPTEHARAGPEVDLAPTAEVEVPLEELVELAEESVESIEEQAEARPGAIRSTAQILFGLIVAPIMGLAFVLFLPVIALGSLIWVTWEALTDRKGPEAAMAAAITDPSGDS
jgi:CheY-like chemotaxis protein